MPLPGVEGMEGGCGSSWASSAPPPNKKARTPRVRKGSPAKSISACAPGLRSTLFLPPSELRAADVTRLCNRWSCEAGHHGTSRTAGVPTYSPNVRGSLSRLLNGRIAPLGQWHKIEAVAACLHRPVSQLPAEEPPPDPLLPLLGWLPRLTLRQRAERGHGLRRVVAQHDGPAVGEGINDPLNQLCRLAVVLLG